MFPYINPPDHPYEQGRPLSRLEVHQQHLDHIRKQHLVLASGNHRPSVMSLGSLIPGLRRSFGGMLISVGRWMAHETSRTSTGPEVMARR